MRKHMINKIIASMLLGVMLIGTISKNVYAASASALCGANSGFSVHSNAVVGVSSASSSSSIRSTYPWKGYSNIGWIGYRIYCIDNSENLCTNVIDLYYDSNSWSGVRLDRLYTSTYTENLVSKISSHNMMKQSELLSQGIELPLGILTPNPLSAPHNFVYDNNGNVVSYEIDKSQYLSTAESPENRVSTGNGIIKWVKDSLGNNDAVNDDALKSPVANANSHSGGSSTQGTTGQSGSSSISNTGNAQADTLMQRINSAISAGETGKYRSLLAEVVEVTGGGGASIFGSGFASSVIAMGSQLSADSSLVKKVEAKYTNGLNTSAKRAGAYNYLVYDCGADRVAAIIAVCHAKKTASVIIGGPTITISSIEEETVDLSQIIPAASNTSEEDESNKYINRLFELSGGLKFVDSTNQQYLDNEVYNAVEVMSMNNYTLVVEPTIAFRWANNTYQKASVGFKCDISHRVTTSHRDAYTTGTGRYWKNGQLVSAGTPGASEETTTVPAVMEEVEITYAWKYRDASGNEQTIEVKETLKEGRNYSSAGGYRSSGGYNTNVVKAGEHLPSYTYNGQAVRWSQSAPVYSSADYASGSYNGYTDWYACIDSNANYKQDSGYTYGSLRDALHYCNGKSGTNSKLLSLITVYLPAAMVVSEDKPFNGRPSGSPFHGLADSDFTFEGKGLSWLSSNSANYGYGLHMYTTEGFFTKTRDDGGTTAGQPHKAPQPENPDKYLGKTGGGDGITIVKTYRTWDGGEVGKGNVVDEQTYIRYKEPSVIYILNEQGWTLSDWYVSGKTSLVRDSSGVDNSQAKWDDMKSDTARKYGAQKNNPSIYRSEHSGRLGVDSNGFPEQDNWKDNINRPYEDGNCKITIYGNDSSANTLYVLYEKASTLDGLTGIESDLKQSEITAVKDAGFTVGTTGFPGWPHTLLATNSTVAGSKYTIARGIDKITFKDFNGNLGSLVDTSAEEQTKQLMDNWYYGAEGGTASFEPYSDSYKLPNTSGSTVDTGITVDVYHGSKNVSANYNITDTDNEYSTLIKTGQLGGIVPYYWMTYSDVNTNKSVMYMACENDSERKLSTYDYAEVVFKQQGSLKVTSNMWATDKSITNAAGGVDVLKGGATFKISTPEYAKLTATTYCTVWDDYDDNTGIGYVASIALSDNSIANGQNLTSASAVDRHDSFIETLSEDLKDDWKIHQYVAQGTNSAPAGADMDLKAPSSSKKVTAGSDIKGLGTGSNTSSKSDKYYLNTNGDIATTAFMETEVEKTSSRYIRVFTLPNGNVYYVTGNSYDDCDRAMVNAMNSAKAAGGQYSVNMVAKKGQYDKILVTDSSVKKAIAKSGALQTLVNSVELNGGNDTTAPWVDGANGDKGWYNEGFWVTILEQKTDISVGIISQPYRMITLDPKLTPQQTKKNDGTVKFNSSAFRADWVANGDTSLGTFRGVQLIGGEGSTSEKGFKNLFGVSNTFYISNSTVSDNK